MRFFRSSDAPKNSSSSSRAKSRFSFRRHSEDDADKPSAPLPTRKQHSHSQPSAVPPRPPVKPVLAATFVSSASTSTSASSSITSPTAIQRRSSANNDSEEPEDTISTPRDSTYLPSTPTGHPPPPFSSSSMKNTADRSASSSSMARTNSSSSNSSSGGGGLGSRSSSQRHSLVGYHQLEFSMSYKNRKTVTDDPLNPHGHGLRSSFVTSSSSSSAGRRSMNHTTRDSTLSLIDELPSPVASSSVPSAPSSSSSTVPSSVPSAPLSEARVNEASVAALQTRRAFQQMVLALEDDESSDYDYDSDSEDRYSFGVRQSSGGGGSGGIVRVGADDYRKFQFRLNHLEELCAEQARKQSHMEQTIEREVQQRTAKVVEAMEKKIAMYKQAKDLEVEREIQRRVSSERGSSMSTPPRESSFFFHQSGGGGAALPPLPVSISSSSPPGDGVDLKGKPLDKIFHPRRTRRRMELLREREEQQKREMEQFREFIRSTEMRSTLAMRPTTMYSSSSSSSADTSARESIAALRDPHITEDLLVASPNELIEMICVLRKHVSVQESQLDEAKKLISAAIEAREEAEETAREAVELTMELDSRLERASQEMIELQRRSSEFYMDRNSQFSASFLRASSSSASAAPVQRQSTHLPRTASFPR